MAASERRNGSAARTVTGASDVLTPKGSARTRAPAAVSTVSSTADVAGRWGRGPSIRVTGPGRTRRGAGGPGATKGGAGPSSRERGRAETRPAQARGAADG